MFDLAINVVNLFVLSIEEASKGNKKTDVIVIATVLPISFLIFAIIGFFIHRRRAKLRGILY